MPKYLDNNNQRRLSIPYSLKWPLTWYYSFNAILVLLQWSSKELINFKNMSSCLYGVIEVRSMINFYFTHTYLILGMIYISNLFKTTFIFQLIRDLNYHNTSGGRNCQPLRSLFKSIIRVTTHLASIFNDKLCLQFCFFYSLRNSLEKSSFLTRCMYWNPERGEK